MAIGLKTEENEERQEYFHILVDEVVVDVSSEAGPCNENLLPNHFIINKIRGIGRNIRSNKIVYKISWLNFPGEDTWEPHLNLVQSVWYVYEFHRNLQEYFARKSSAGGLDSTDRAWIEIFLPKNMEEDPDREEIQRLIHDPKSGKKRNPKPKQRCAGCSKTFVNIQRHNSKCVKSSGSSTKKQKGPPLRGKVSPLTENAYPAQVSETIHVYTDPSTINAARI
ncbi:unnamed protein product, partial [Allacma fusca]